MFITDIFKDVYELTDERWTHIIKEHPEVEQYKERIQEVLLLPDYVKKSKRDAEVLLYYKFYDDIFLRVNPVSGEVVGFSILNFRKWFKDAKDIKTLPIKAELAVP